MRITYPTYKTISLLQSECPNRNLLPVDDLHLPVIARERDLIPGA